MKILYIASGTGWGGGSIGLYNLVKGLKERGHEILIMVPKNKGRLCDELKLIGIPFVKAHYGLCIYPETRNVIQAMKKVTHLLYKELVGRWSVRKNIKTFHPDIVHTNIGPLDIALRECVSFGIPHVWHIREYQDLDFAMRFFPKKEKFEEMIHSKGNYNIAITQGVYNYWGLRDGIDRVIYDGVFEDIKEDILFPPKSNYFLFVGRIEEAKGLFELIEVFSVFHRSHPMFTLKVAGACSNLKYKRKCDRFIMDNGLIETVEFLGERKDVYELMRKALAIVVPSRFEGFGFITVEAMLNNCLVIGKNTAGTKEQFDIGHEMTGKEIGLRYSTKTELVSCLIWAISHRYSDILNTARHVVQNKYSQNRHCVNIESYYKFVLAHYKSKT